MKLLKNLAITGSLGMIAFAGLASASTIAYNTSLGGNGFYNGSGNTDNDFAVLTDGNLQLGLKAVNRYTGSPELVPTGDNYDYNDNPNVDPSRQWGFYYSIDTRSGGGTGTIADYSYLLTLTDETTSTTDTFNPILPDDSYYDGSGLHGGSSNNTPVADQNSFYGIQNAEWPAYSLLLGSGWNPHDVYTITLTATPTLQGTADSLSIRVNGTPEPGTILTMLGSLGALGLIVRRRKA
jgi:hypothetical protein